MPLVFLNQRPLSALLLEQRAVEQAYVESMFNPDGVLDFDRADPELRARNDVLHELLDLRLLVEPRSCGDEVVVVLRRERPFDLRDDAYPF